MNKTSKDQFIKNMKGWNDDLHKDLARYIVKMEKEDDIQKIFKLKVKMLNELIESLPINPRTCIFCLSYEDCKDCSYGKKHDCSAISDGQEFFLDWIEEHYA